MDLRDEPSQLVTLANWHHTQWSYLNPGQTLQDRIDKMQKYLDPVFIPSMYMAKQIDLLGSAAIVKHDMDTRRELSPWLASVYVVPEFRGKGVGTLLVKHVMQEALVNGIRKLYLFTPDQEEFYRRLGWHTIEKTAYLGVPVSIMSAQLETHKG